MSNFSLKSEPAHPARQHVGALDALQRDMLDALHDDQVKAQINDAKLRAVKQRVEYDDFEKLVAGAHLRPIKPKSDTLNDVCKAFDGFVLPRHEPAASGPALPPRAAVPAEGVPPVAKTSNEFTRTWKRQCKTPAVRRAYLRQLDPDTLPLIFRTELDPALFDSIVATLGEAWLAAGVEAEGDTGAPATSAAADDDLAELDGVDDAPAPSGDAAARELVWAAALLGGIARLNRFDLTLDFADKATLDTLGQMLDAMGGVLDGAELDGLRKQFRA